MIIKRLTMYNFGVYAGLNTFDFDSNKPIVLIGGLNGRGKTTFLEAILLALYGNNSISYKESPTNSYGQYLRSYVNKNSEDQKTFIELEFVIQNSNVETYLVRREWDALSKRTKEEIIVSENGEYSDFLTENWTMFVEKILPSALSNFYFFDGEKIAELAVDDTNTQLKNSIRSMLGITVLDVLKNDIERSMRMNKKNLDENHSEEELHKIKQKLEALNQNLSEIDTLIEKCETSISSKNAEIEDLQQSYQIKGGNVEEQRSELMKYRAVLQAELEKNNDSLIEVAASELPLILVYNLIQDIKLQAEDEHNDSVMSQALDQIEYLLNIFGKEHSEQLAASKEFVQYVRDHTRNNYVEQIYNLSDYAIFQLNSLLEGTIEQSRENAKSYLNKKTELSQKLDQIESYLSIDTNSDDLSKIYETIKEKEKSLINENVNLYNLVYKRNELKSSITTLTSEYNLMIEKYLQSVEIIDDTDRMMKYSNMALILLEKYTIKLQNRKTGLLAETITNCYKELSNKKNLIQKIIMDPETLMIKYLDKFGSEVKKDSLSAGEKQLMVIAILWALAICSKKKLPVIIDTPLSRLDSMHRTSLVKTYFPNASDQTIILSTDSEIDKTYYEMMKDYVGNEFTLVYNEETQSTSIQKGYFQK